MMRVAWMIALLVVTPLVVAPPADAEEVRVAVAANFTAAMRQIAADFAAETGHEAVVSYGSTGKLYAQIENGAPFDVFLAADQTRPRLLADAGRAGAPFTYAVGKLVLWSADPALVDDQGEVLRSGNFERLAIANPKTAPYGAAAMEVIRGRGVQAGVEPRLVRGDSITQTYQFVLTGNAQLGFVALSQVAAHSDGSRWEPPQELYAPIRQDGVLLQRGRGNQAAAALIDFLKGPAARAVVKQYGYGVE